MEFTHAPVVPRNAATVMLVRDAPAGIEVLMLLKTLKAEFAGGAYVFPGGAVDASDSSEEVRSVCEGLDDTAASALLGIGEGGLAFWVAAVRECFEEAGILLAHGPDGSPVALAAADVASRFHGYRSRVEAREMTLGELCRAEELTLPVGSIHYVSHWITPEGAPRRYDTRFFVTEVPAAQRAANDGSETVENVWITPGDALARGKSGEFQLIFPTISNLETLAGYDTVADLMGGMSQRREVPTVAPRITVDGGTLRFLLPGDPGYDTPATGHAETRGESR